MRTPIIKFGKKNFVSDISILIKYILNPLRAVGIMLTHSTPEAEKIVQEIF